jgi:hypothetical protein
MRDSTHQARQRYTITNVPLRNCFGSRQTLCLRIP